MDYDTILTFHNSFTPRRESLSYVRSLRKVPLEVRAVERAAGSGIPLRGSGEGFRRCAGGRTEPGSALRGGPDAPGETRRCARRPGVPVSQIEAEKQASKMRAEGAVLARRVALRLVEVDTLLGEPVEGGSCEVWVPAQE